MSSTISRELQHAFKFGKYVIYSIPFNVVVGEWYVGQEGKSAGMEKMRTGSQSFHKNYSRAIDNLVDRCIIDGISEASLKMLKDLPISIQKVKDELDANMQEHLKDKGIPNLAPQP